MEEQELQDEYVGIARRKVWLKEQIKEADKQMDNIRKKLSELI